MDLKDLKYYQNYHKHTSLSHRYNKDSPLTYNNYFKYYNDNYSSKGLPQIYSTVEHGWQSTYFHIYDDLEKFNKNNSKDNPNYKPIKFIFGTEGYWVKDRFEKDTSNCHIILLAKNENGRKKLNRAIYESFKTGYYYKNRMDLDILLSLPKSDIFVTSACLAFWNSYKIDNNDLPFVEEPKEIDYTKIDEIVLKLYNHFDDFYLEVQANQTDIQKEINRHILQLHYQYGIPIIAGTDSHVIDNSQLVDRDDLLKSNKISYPEEEGWYMDCPSIEEFIRRFQEQGILSDDEIYEAINNTNKILDFEDIILDRSLKVPVAKKYKHLSLEERNNIFENILREEWKKQYNDINEDKFDQYIKEIKHDIKEVEACHMADYFIDNYEIMKLGQEKYGGILTPSGRGSGVSMYLNKLLGFTKVDKVNSPVLMYSERFLTKERVLDSKTPPDIDHNVADREPFIQAQKDVICEEGTFDLIALGTLKYKSAFKMYARAYELDPQIANDVTKQITKYENALKYAEEDEKEYIDIFDYVDKEKYGDLIEGCQEYMGIVDNLKSHPCGCLCYDGDAIEDVGVIMVRSESTGRECFVALLESGTIDVFGYLKQDYLIVDSIGLTYDIYKEIGMKPLTVNELLDKIRDDEKVWNIYKNGYTMCINQCEQERSTKKVGRYKPKNISELTQFVAGIRPSFKTMYKIFESRQHFDYGIKAFDSLIQDEYCDSSFILYQEHLMKVLGFAGFPMSETYTIIKAISKKKQYVIKGAKEKFIPNFAQAILHTGETNDLKTAEEMSHKVWQIIEDSAAYGFNSAHAYCMAIDSVTLAWQKAYYPLEFYKVTLQRYTNKGNKDKVSLLKKEMLRMGIKLNPIKFGDDNRQFSIDREHHSINQTMASIKDMQKIVPDLLYKIGLNYQDNGIFFIFRDMLKSKINKKSFDILIKLNYFRDFGDINYVLNQLEIYKEMLSIIDKLIECKQLKKDYCEEIGLPIDKVKLCCKTETPKMFKDIDNEKLAQLFKDNYIEIENKISEKYNYQPITTLDIIKYQIKLLGYSDIVDKSISQDIYIVEQQEANNYGTPFVSLYHPYDGESLKSIKVDKKWFNEYPCDIGDSLRCSFKDKPKKRKDENGKWYDTGEIEHILNIYSIV